MFASLSVRKKAALTALFVTLIWSISWVFIKTGLQDIPPLLFAGMRYAIAATCLILLVLRSPASRAEVRAITPKQWRSLFALGVVIIAVAQGAQFGALERLPAATLSLILNFTTIMVAFMSTFMLREAPTRIQVVGIVIYLIGMFVYFGRVEIDADQQVGLLIAFVCLAANALGTILMRGVNRGATLSPLVITATHMGIGAIILLIVGIGTNGIPYIPPQSLLIIVWLAVVHTALAFTLWNGVLRVLNAIEASLINSLVAVFIAPLAWIFLGEALTTQGVLGLVIAVGGVMLVQVSGMTVAQNFMHRAIDRVIRRKTPIVPPPPM